MNTKSQGLPTVRKYIPSPYNPQESNWPSNTPLRLDSTVHPIPSRDASETSDNGYGLFPSELIWRERYEFLLQKGYTLRDRYNPGRTLSWIGTSRLPRDCEDRIETNNDSTMDAIRHTVTQEGVKLEAVCMKIVRHGSKEVEIARLLSTPDRLRNPLNHCVPILEDFLDPIPPSKPGLPIMSLLVMPYLRPFNNPSFGKVGEVVDFIKQTLEGLEYIHSQGVAHRDCAAGNIMMDGRPLYPNGHHPARLHLSVDGRNEARQLSRIDHPVKYFYIDFGLSSYFKSGESEYVLGRKGQSKPPELSDETPYNAYMADIWMLGCVYNEHLLQVYSNLDFLKPLVSAMLHHEPARRPTAFSAVTTFNSMRRPSPGDTQWHWRLRGRSETGPEQIVYDAIDYAKQIVRTR